MKRVKSVLAVSLLILFAMVNIAFPLSAKSIKITNSKISLRINFDTNNRISGETFSAVYKGSKKEVFSTDGNFKINLVWTYWSAPGKKNNADVQLKLTKNDFYLENSVTTVGKDGTQNLLLLLTSKKFPFALKIKYSLGKNSFYLRKQLTISDTVYQDHFLQKIFVSNSKITGIGKVLKTGGFGQPAAFSANNHSVFVGVEFPISTTHLKTVGSNYYLITQEEFGEKITGKGVASKPVVYGITPQGKVKYYFNKYIDDIRVAPLKPYALYNSWYDLRSAEYPGVKPKYKMNEKNVFRIIDEIRKNFIEKHGIQINAFVLDDGWDVYESDWQLRRKQFPHGLKPISDKLKKMNTVLGIWFGPTGGYSFRMKRINWMKQHGYEVVGSTKKNWQAMMCLAGKNYKRLFTKRVTDFVKNYNVGYFKWDGIQFSCSEPNHGHPVGIYSRRAVMNTVAELCDTVRKLNPNVFLNITSGTWLSPWWVKYANTIWMQGGDYGYSDVPSISKRDRAITYRDITLYNDFRKNNFWFPIANLMTHGIIKGELQKLGGATEPLDKFTDNAVLYFARGVTMYEFYISSDILTNDEWDALAKSLKWAKYNFDILKNSEMFGGNPEKSEPYGFAHYAKDKAIFAVRNPKIQQDFITLKLDTTLGFDSKAKNIVLQEIYPRKTLSGKIYKAGDKIKLKLNGFETAVFYAVPLKQIIYPAISGVDFFSLNKISAILAPTGKEIKILDKKLKIKLGKNFVTAEQLQKYLVKNSADRKPDYSLEKKSSKYIFKYSFSPKVKDAELNFLIKTDKNDLPDFKVELNGKAIKVSSVKQKRKWSWNTVQLSNTNNVVITFPQNKKFTVAFYLTDYEKAKTTKITFGKELKSLPPLPPRPWKENLIKQIYPLTLKQ